MAHSIYHCHHPPRRQCLNIFRDLAVAINVFWPKRKSFVIIPTSLSLLLSVLSFISLPLRYRSVPMVYGHTAA